MTTFTVQQRRVATTSAPSQDGGNTLLLSLLLLLLMGGVLAFGAVQPWGELMLELGAASLLLIWMAMQAVRGEIELTHAQACIPAAVFGLVVFAQLASNRSAHIAVTRERASVLAACLVIFLVTPTAARSSSYLRRVAIAWSVFGALVTVFGIAQFFTAPRMLYWVIRPASGGDSVFGPYVNHNHYAGMIELLLPMPTMLALGDFLPREKRLFAGIVAVLMAVSVFLCGSRMGMLSILAEMLVIAILIRSRRLGLRSGLIPFLLICLVAGAALFWLGDQPVFDRMLTMRNALAPGVNGHRLTIARDSFALAKEHPLLGSGLGTFADVYIAHRSFYSKLLVNEAHNDYIQAIVETGFIGFGAMIWFMVVLFRSGFRSIDDCFSRPGTAVRVGACVACVGLAVHSFADFNLQIPANAALCAMMAAIACTPPSRPEKRTRSAPSIIMMP